MLGSGGMAEVHLARQRGLKRFRKLVVVKTVHPQLARDHRFIDLLLEEARISALLKHPRVVDIYDVGEADGTYFIAMEYLPGQSLTEVIRAGRRTKKIDVQSSARIIADAAEGLEAAHNLKSLTGEKLELVHRDVSPGNIIVLYSGDVKLVDFGVAKARGHLSHTKIGKFAGKLGYAAPEQLRDDAADRRSDVFSLGVVFWELLCHRRLFQCKNRDQALALVSSGNAPPPSRYRKETPAIFDELCLKALRPDPDERFQTAGEMLEAIEEGLESTGRRRQTTTIAAYMEEIFSEERHQTEVLVRRVAESTNQIQLADFIETDELDDDDDAATTVDENVPAAIAELAAAAAAKRAAARDEEPVEVDTEVEAEPDSGAEPESEAEPASGQESDGSVAAPLSGTSSEPITPPPALTRLLKSDKPWRRSLVLGAGVGLVVMALVVVVKIATSGASHDPIAAPSEAADAAAAVGLPVDPPEPEPDPSALDPEPDPEPQPDPSELDPDPEPDPDSQRERAPDTTAADRAAAERAAEKQAAEKRAADKKAAEKKAAAERAAASAAAKEAAEREAAKKAVDREAARGHYRDGMRAYSRGQLESAERSFRQALAANPRMASAHRGLGFVHARRGAKSSAIRAFRRYLRMAPRAGDAASIRQRIEEMSK